MVAGFSTPRATLAIRKLPARRLNEQAKRNQDRFPDDFMFQLTGEEKAEVISGNAVFLSNENDAPQLSDKIRGEIGKRRGFEPNVLLLELEDIERAISENPFAGAETDPKSLHVGFLASAPRNPDLKTLENLKKDSERFRLINSVFYLYAPEGVGRSKLAGNAEKLLRVVMTDRNWRTVSKIREMVKKQI
jgi:uncharacterized protein (DUF1697 family)